MHLRHEHCGPPSTKANPDDLRIMTLQRNLESKSLPQAGGLSPGFFRRVDFRENHRGQGARARLEKCSAASAPRMSRRGAAEARRHRQRGAGGPGRPEAWPSSLRRKREPVICARTARVSALLRALRSARRPSNLDVCGGVARSSAFSRMTAAPRGPRSLLQRARGRSRGLRALRFIHVFV